MSKMTDESVAKALGFKRIHVGNWFNEKKRRHEKSWDWRHPQRPHPDSETWGVPPFTTSLDAIVAEVEARGLDWAAGNFERGTPSHQATVGSFKTKIAKVQQAATPALALCAALLAYLKQAPMMKENGR